MICCQSFGNARQSSRQKASGANSHLPRRLSASYCLPWLSLTTRKRCWGMKLYISCARNDRHCCVLSKRGCSVASIWRHLWVCHLPLRSEPAASPGIRAAPIFILSRTVAITSGFAATYFLLASCNSLAAEIVSGAPRIVDGDTVQLCLDAKGESLGLRSCVPRSTDQVLQQPRLGL